MNILAVGCGTALLFILNIIKLIIETERRESFTANRENIFISTLVTMKKWALTMNESYKTENL
jgi:hypothetical protein